jgi:hypothetical protein
MSITHESDFQREALCDAFVSWRGSNQEKHGAIPVASK